MQEITYEARFGLEPPVFTQRVVYSYNTQGQLSSVSADSAGIPWQKFTMSYDGKGRVVQVNGNRETYLNEYNEQNQRVRQIRSYRGQNGVLKERDYYSFIYNSRNELEEAHYLYVENGKATLYGAWRYTYSNGDPTTIQYFSYDPQREVNITLRYDDKKRHPQEQAYTFFQPLQPPSAHNLLGYNTSEPYDDMPKYNATYTYTSQGYPATMIKSDFDTGMIENFRYTYSCH